MTGYDVEHAAGEGNRAAGANAAKQGNTRTAGSPALPRGSKQASAQ